ncbi:MAG TPA: zf-TFIIB domain-containing protein [Kofleriaceae bacterium]|nr:zf-TFIIB domain-containing protein [Kofleriaceae bacterium]
MGSPYRERPRFLLCPRCGEVLDRAFEGVSTCLRCEGLWISPGTLDAAFGNPRWPSGNTMWWRNSVECPECVFEGKATVMSARMSDDVIVDQCPDHGVWLDRGELGRLMGVAEDELGALRSRLKAMAPDLDQLVARRQKWRTDLEARRKAALEHRQRIEEEHRQRIAISERARRREEVPRERATASLREPPPAEPVAPREAHPAQDPDGAARRTAEREQIAGARRAQAAAEVARLQDRLGVLHDHIRRLEVKLAEARHRAADVDRELDAAIEKVRALDAEPEDARL